MNLVQAGLNSSIAGLAASPYKDKRIKGLVSGQNGAMMHFDECGSTLDFSDFGRASNWISSGTCSENQVTCRSDDDCSGETNTCTNLFDPLVEHTGPLILSYSADGNPADQDEISALLLPQQEEVNAFVAHTSWLGAGGPNAGACTSPVTVDLSGEEDVVLPIVFLPALDGYTTGGDMNGHFFSVDRTNRLRQHFPIYGSCPDVAGMWEHADSPQMDYEVPVSPLVIWNSAKDEATDTSARDLIYVYLVDTGIDGSDVVQGATIKRIDTTIYRRCGGDLEEGDPCLTVADCTAQSCLAPTGNDHLWQDGASATLSAESLVVSPVLDADGDVYVATKTTEDKGRIYKFNEDLQHQWGDDTTPEPLEFDNPIAAMLVSSSSTYPDGLLYAVTTEGILYAIERGGKAAEE
ncbi:MAG: hypothetical protein CL440_07765, partial [Acidimicrobiaceae bacterium]|nr:hypothetical protein [Acidimicrobiaceae bacterium]